MMEENNDVFLAGGDALVYLAESMYKRYSKTLFGVIHFVRTYLVTDFSTPPPPLRTCAHFGWPPSIPSTAYVLNG